MSGRTGNRRLGETATISVGLWHRMQGNQQADIQAATKSRSIEDRGLPRSLRDLRTEDGLKGYREVPRTHIEDVGNTLIDPTDLHHM